LAAFFLGEQNMMIYSLVKNIDTMEDKEKQKLLGDLVEKIELRDQGEVRAYLAENRVGNKKSKIGSSESFSTPRSGRCLNL
jgi:hypothetical protein